MKSLLVVCLLIAGLAQAKPITDPVFMGGLQDNAKWTPPTTLFSNCSQKATKPGQFENCILSKMKSQGASPQALAFWKLAHGFVQTVKKYPHVTVVQALVYAADHSEDYFLITDQGVFIGASDPEVLKDIDIKKAPLHRCIIQFYPDAWLLTLANNFPQQEILSDGTQQFIFNYQLVNGCKACEVAGNADVAFNFSKQGKFSGVKLLRLNAQGPLA